MQRALAGPVPGLICGCLREKFLRRIRLPGHVTGRGPRAHQGHRPIRRTRSRVILSYGEDARDI